MKAHCLGRSKHFLGFNKKDISFGLILSDELFGYFFFWGGGGLGGLSPSNSCEMIGQNLGKKKADLGIDESPKGLCAVDSPPALSLSLSLSNTHTHTHTHTHTCTRSLSLFSLFLYLCLSPVSLSLSPSLFLFAM